MIEQRIDGTAAAARRGDGGYAFGIWPAQSRQLALIRVEMRRWLVSLGVMGALQEDLVLAAGEAAANSIEHAYPEPTADDTVELMFWTDSGTVCIQIVDHGLWRTPPTDLDGRGRGIVIMRRLMKSVLIQHGAGGTTVLLRTPMPAAPLP